MLVVHGHRDASPQRPGSDPPDYSEGLPTKVLILSSYGDDEYVHQLTRKRGASGYLIKQTAATDLIKAIRETCRGNAFFSPTSISKQLLDYCRGGRRKGPSLRPGLGLRWTSRELGVLQLVAEGNGNKQIMARPSPQYQNGRKASAAADEQTGHPRYRRPHPVCDRPQGRGKPLPPGGGGAATRGGPASLTAAQRRAGPIWAEMNPGPPPPRSPRRPPRQSPFRLRLFPPMRAIQRER